MLTMRGRYNTANIMVDAIDETTRAQIQGVLDHPAFEGSSIAIMPDCHAGKGAVIGFTMKMNRYVIPNVIGVDIGCGMLMAKYPISEVSPPVLDALIKRAIPSGFLINDRVVADRRTIAEVTEVFGMIGIDAENALWAAGSLGEGNHFIEAGFDASRRLVGFLRGEPVEVFESVHNFIGDDGIIRKGAPSARLGEKVIIPFNMADGIALCVGRGSEKYNFSAPHGAGRILSRTQAKKTLSVQDFTARMKKAGVYTTTATRETLDEAPGAYKPKDVILKNIAETVEVIEFIRPVYNFKAGGD